jgi:hypothetical protein
MPPLQTVEYGLERPGLGARPVVTRDLEAKPSLRHRVIGALRRPLLLLGIVGGSEEKALT